MRGFVFGIAALLAIGFITDASARPEKRALAGAETETFRGVGRVDIGGRRFCTGALISDRLVLTAAHCLYDQKTRERTPLSQMSFVAGLNDGTHAARRRIVRAAVRAGHVYDGRASLGRIGSDVALLELDRPAPNAPAYPVEGTGWTGAPVTLVSYARDSARRPSIQQGCRPRAVFGQVAALDCEALHGASGSPIFREENGRRSVIGVVSAMGGAKAERRTALVVLAAPFLAELRAGLRPEGGPVAPSPPPAVAAQAGRFAGSR